jgi:Dolichyl-phosphate-mannose-protein mannosyltransferase
VISRIGTVWVAVALVVCLGLTLRFQAARSWNASRPDAPARLTGDEPGYDRLARDLLDGRGFTWPGRVPLYPLWIAALHRVTGFSYARAIYYQCLLGALAVALTFILGRQVFGTAAGLIAAFGAAVDIVLITQSVRFMSEILFTPAVIVLAISFTHALSFPSIGRFGWVGFWIGVANLIRPTLVAFPLAAVLVVGVAYPLRRAAAWMGVVTVVSCVVVLPWIVHNYIRYGAVYPLATSNGVLWQGSPEYYHLIRDRGYTYLDVWNKVIYGPGNEGHDAGSIEGERYCTARALRSIAREPLLYARFCLEKAVTYWIGDPNADWGDSFIFNYRALRLWGMSRSTTTQYMFWRAFPILAFASLLLLRGSYRRLAGILSILAYCTLLHALMHAEARLSEPLHPLLLVIAAGAASRVWSGGFRRVHSAS